MQKLGILVRALPALSLSLLMFSVWWLSPHLTEMQVFQYVLSEYTVTVVVGLFLQAAIVWLLLKNR